MMLYIIDIFALAACGIGAFMDLRFRRIPNALTFGAAIGALGLHAALGIASFATALLVMTIVTTIGLFLFSFKLIGGGDVKLVAAVAGAFSFPDAVPFVLYTMIGGGVLALAYAFARGTLKQTAQNTFVAALPLLYRRLPASLPAVTEKMPYGLAIFMGASLIVLSHGVAPFLRLPI